MQTQTPPRAEILRGSRPFVAFLLALVLFAIPAGLRAQTSFTASWDANPETDIAGYKVYLGTSSGFYSVVKDVVGGTSVVLSGLAPSTTYFCAVQAYNTAGVTSEMSDEVTKTTSAASTPEIAVSDAAGSALTSGAATLSFGSVTLGASGPSKTITISNSGTATLTGLAVTAEGSNTADFAISSLAATTLAPGTSTSLTVIFSPTAAGARSALIKIASNDADENPFQIALAGDGTTVTVPASPEIAVFRADGTGLTDGGASVAFGSLNLGATGVAQTFTVRNTGTAALSALAVTLDGANAPDFTLTTLGASSIAAGGSSTFTITFKPGAAGARAAAVHIASNDADESSFDISLSGTGVAVSEIAVENSEGINLTDGSGGVAFGSLNLGASGTTKSFTIRNSGTATLSGLAVTVDGSHVSDFTVSTLGASSIAAGGNATFTVTFKPNATGARGATLHIASNDADESPFDIALSGTGVAVAEIAVENSEGANLTDGSANVGFGTPNLGAPGTTRSFTIRNPGSAALSGLALAVDGSHAADFAVSTLPANTLAPGANMAFTVTFTPAAAGSRTATLHIASSDADESPFDILLTGNGGTAPEVAVEFPIGAEVLSGSAVVSFEQRNLLATAIERHLTIRNQGTAELTGLALSISGEHAADFTMSSFSVTALAPGASAKFAVIFKPTAAGARRATLRIASNDSDENPFIVQLVGNGVATPDIDVTPTDGGELATASASNAFGRVSIGETSAARSFTIHNRGSDNLTLQSLSATGKHAADFVLQGPAADKLAPGASTTFTVAFKPGAAGERVANLLIASNDPDENPFAIPVFGIGVASAEIQVAATGAGSLTSGGSAVDFGTANAGSKGEVRIFTIRNAGTGTLTGLKLKPGENFSPAFDVGDLDETSLAPGKSATFRVTFRPGKPGALKTTLLIASNDADEARFEIPLTGKAVPVPHISIRIAGGSELEDDDSFVTFGGATGGARRFTRTFIITNRGHAKLTGLSLTRNGIHAEDFIATRLKLKSLAPGKSASIKVNFKPGSSGDRWGAIHISSNDPDIRVFDINLAGRDKARPSAKSSRVEKPKSSKAGISPQADKAADTPVSSVVIIDGQKYRCITIPKTEGVDANPRSVQVSGNLVDWSSGRNHTTVIRDNANVLKVRDNIPLTPGTKRFIRAR